LDRGGTVFANGVLLLLFPQKGKKQCGMKSSLFVRFGQKIMMPILKIDFAATHRSLWFGSRPRPATGFLFL